MKTRFAYALFFATFAAAHSRGSPQGTFKKVLHRNGNDMTVLLQGEMRLASEKHGDIKVDTDETRIDADEACRLFSGRYQPVAGSACADKMPKGEKPNIDSMVVEQFASIGEPTTEAILKEQDPPGATIFKNVLWLGIVLLFFDGVRRWHLQQQDAETPKQSAGAWERQPDDCAWANLVKTAAAGDVPNFKVALQQCTSVTREDPWGCTPLHFAATGGSAEIATDLLSRGAEVDAMDACDETALHFAARAGHAGFCEVLLNKGADINATNVQNMTPLVVAGHAKQRAACRLLVDYGASAGGIADEHLPMLVVSELVHKVVQAPLE